MFTKNQVTDAVTTYEFEARRIATRPINQWYSCRNIRNSSSDPSNQRTNSASSKAIASPGCWQSDATKKRKVQVASCAGLNDARSPRGRGD